MDHPRDGSKALDVFRVADLLVSRATQAHGADIDLIAYYGSYAQGVAGSNSDLDTIYIPAEGKDPPVQCTILVQGILFDFWAIRWNTMEGFATGRFRGWSLAPAIVHHARPLYSQPKSKKLDSRRSGRKCWICRSRTLGRT